MSHFFPAPSPATLALIPKGEKLKFIRAWMDEALLVVGELFVKPSLSFAIEEFNRLTQLGIEYACPRVVTPQNCYFFPAEDGTPYFVTMMMASKEGLVSP